jgi:transcriptional regulator with XRE-family HTH domain
LGATQGAPGGGGLHQEELATIAGLSVHAASALERGERRRPHVETVRALSAALDLTGPARDAFLGSARAVPPTTASDELSRAALPVPLTVLIGRDADIDALRQWLGDRVLGLITLIGRSREDFRRLGVLPGLLPIDAAETVLAGYEDVSHGGVEVPARGWLDRQEPSSAIRNVGRGHVSAVSDARHDAGVRNARTRRGRVSATTHWRGWRGTAPAKRRLPRPGWVGPAQVRWLDRARDDRA